MASLTKRAIVLIICRVFNFAVLAVSPMILVRIFDVRSYGQYREFILYAIMISGLVEFTINTNLIYFIPKYPTRERQSVTHTALLILGASAIGLVALCLLRGLVLSHTSFDFIVPLMLYLLFNLNFEFFENYWLGRKRTDYVLYYSSARVAVRTTAIVVSAALSRSVMTVIETMVVVELAKCVFVFVMLRGVLTKNLDRALFREQLRYILPLGASSTISLVNNQLANLFISIRMGVEKLAIYTTGAYQIPVINIIRSSVMDVLFPEMAQIGDADRLRLWQRANVVFCFLIFPVYVVFFYYAPTVIITLFTKSYAASIPLFRIYLTLLVLQCFDMASPLRAMNKNVYFILGMLLDLSTNLLLLLVFFPYVGFFTPALTFIIGETTMGVYLALTIIRVYRIGLRELFMWRKIGTIVCCLLIALPMLIVSNWVGMNAVAKAVLFSSAYLVVYYFILRKFKIDEIELLVEKLMTRYRRWRERALPAQGEAGSRRS